MMNKCNNCKGKNTEVIYDGPIRKQKKNIQHYIESKILKCNNCGLVFLSQDSQMSQDIYTTSQYRELLDQSYDQAHLEVQNEDAEIYFSYFSHYLHKSMTVADVGCGAGFFLNKTIGVTSKRIGVESDPNFKTFILEQGNDYYSSLEDAVKHCRDSVDLVFSFMVIEHVFDLNSFIKNCLALLKKGGKLILTTPNLDEVLMKIDLKEYNAHFFRQHHNFYFNNDNIKNLSELHNLDVISYTKHRYSVSNFLNWIKNKEPNHVKNNPLESSEWIKELELNNLGDILVLEVIK